ncbi:MAG TPA: twin-arginine translocase subunit TatC [Longimicrobiales bacterium]|nr:twin-arginine translocase subunit TatC [Longimicrobiales bacterium]
MMVLRKLKPGSPTGEMPFFDHLEELRWRIVWSLLALAIGTGIGFYAAIRFDLFSLLKRPVDPYIDGTELIALSVTAPFMITFQIALTVGVILAAPIIVYQVWSFLAPALTKREKRYIAPALYLGAVLFCGGVYIAFQYVLPMTLQFMGGFQSPGLRWALTADLYFGFVLKLLVAFGLMFELPVVVMILTALGLITSKFLASKRRYAIAIMAVTAALITPGDAITATVFMMGPLIALYEVGILLSRLVERGRAGQAAEDALAGAG